MTYKKNFVVAVKVNGKILRESNDRVELPFGSEYSILLKNLDSVRMQARIFIDGEDASGWLVLQPSSSVDVERFVKEMDRGNRFKFIELTERIEKHRGIKADDGLIRVEFRREKLYESPKVVEQHNYHYYYSDGRFPYYWYPNHSGYPTLGIQNSSQGLLDKSVNVLRSNSMSASCSVAALSQGHASAGVSDIAKYTTQPEQSVGITVAGSLSNQKFISVNGFETERFEVIVLHLVGKKHGACVQAAKTVHTMLQCDTCGKTSKSSAKFCKECGTSLEKV